MSRQSEVLALMRQLQPRQSRYMKRRIGTLGDGGYVLPDDLEGLSSVLSIGVGGEVSFDHFFARQGIPVYQYDPTVPGPPVEHAGFHFHKTAWGPQDDADNLTLAGMVARHQLHQDANSLLKFDTEGAEWSCLPGTSADVLKPFRIIVCELHGLNSLQNPAFMLGLRQSLDLLTRHHTVVHLHANNCCGLTLIEGVPVPAVVELTLLRNDRSDFSPCHASIPGPLDYPSMPDRPDLVLKIA